jgi:hypothetical protein
MTENQAVQSAIDFLNANGFGHVVLRMSRRVYYEPGSPSECAGRLTFSQGWLMAFENRPPGFDPAQDVTPAIAVIVDETTGAAAYA